MNLHLSGDDKFIDFIITDIERLGLATQNDFVAYVHSEDDFKFIKSAGVKKLVHQSEHWSRFFREDIKKYERVFIHFFDGILYDEVAAISAKTKVIWCFYGADGLLYFSESRFLQPLTKALVNKKNNERFGPLSVALTPLIYVNRFLFLRKRRRRMRTAFNRVNYFANFLEADFSLLKAETRSGFEHVEMTFGSLETLIPRDLQKNAFVNGDSILLGNSQTPTNNHLDVMEKIKPEKLGKREIYCPLSYGDQSYGDVVEREGQRRFGKNFISMRDFLSLQEYNIVLRKCGFVIMNQDRSQGGANSVISLFYGAKVFMSDRSPLFSFFKELGMSIFSVQHDLVTQEAFEPLPDDKRLLNRRIIEQYFGREAHEKRLLRALSI